MSCRKYSSRTKLNLNNFYLGREEILPLNYVISVVENFKIYGRRKKYKRDIKDSIDKSKCIFCNDLPKDQILKVFDKFLLVVNLYPYEKNHILLLPKRHIHSELEFSDEIKRELEMIHHYLLEIFYKQLGMCFYFTRESTPNQTIWHWHRHYMPTDWTLKNGINRVPYEGIDLVF